MGAFASWDDASTCETNEWMSLYSCRVKNICNSYKDWVSFLYDIENYENADDYKTNNQLWYISLESAKDIYQKNISSIYKCAIINVQKKSLTKLKEEFIKMENTWTLWNRIKSKIEAKIQKVELQWTSLGCKNSTETDIYSKLNILKQTTYEMCRYVVYLEYLKSYYKIPSKLLDTENKNNESYTFSETIRKSMEVNNKIQEEKIHSYKVFPVVFHAYSEYENNLPSHLFLELIREDYLVIRDKLQDALSPINQVGYKIMNAMQE